jgi:6-phosphofructokinase 1
MKKRYGILTGGGDVPPLNAVLYSANQAAIENNIELIGFKSGWQGLLDQDFIDISKLNINPHIGGTILKSSRVNLSGVPDGAKKIVSCLEKLNIDGLIVIGGEDTLSNAFHLTGLPVILISKTIDNDVGQFTKDGILNHFTLGYPTAAEKIASYVSLNEGLRTTAYSHERIIIVESMGMHAGWLAVSSALGNPDFIIIPEFPLNYDLFKEKVKERYLRNKNVIAVIAEGSRWDNNSYISADESNQDGFGHPKFIGASEILAKRLKIDLKPYFDTRNVNSVNPSYLYKSGKPNELDFSTAIKLGREAVKYLNNNPPRPVFLFTEKSNEDFIIGSYGIDKLNNIEDIHRYINEEFYNPDDLNATASARKYLSSINKNNFSHEHYGF